MANGSHLTRNSKEINSPQSDYRVRLCILALKNTLTKSTDKKTP